MRKKPPEPEQVTVDCPYCGEQQKEAATAVSTVCRHCKNYLSIKTKKSGLRLNKPKPTRLIECPECHVEQKVYEDAFSALCVGCGAHLDIGNYTLEGTIRQRLSTSGDITFTSSAIYAGPEVRAQKVTISGQIKARIRAVREILLARKSEVRGTLVAPRIRVLRGANAKVDRIQTDRFEALGELETKQLFARKGVHIGKEGRVAAVALITPEVIVDLGGALSGTLDTEAVPSSSEGEGHEVES